MPTYQVALKQRKELAYRTTAFYFEKPAGFRYRAGQAADFALPASCEGEANECRRTFTLASAPHECDLMIAARIRDSAFKQHLATIPIGTSLTLDGPFGELALDAGTSRTSVFLAGGIGITPFRSMILEANCLLRPGLIILFYSNPSIEQAAFLDELQAWNGTRSNLTFVPTITQPQKSEATWNGFTGRISLEMLRQFIPDLHEPIYYVVGSGLMVKAMREMLEGAGVNDSEIRYEEFFGY